MLTLYITHSVISMPSLLNSNHLRVRVRFRVRVRAICSDPLLQ